MMSLLCTGLSHRTAPVALRERLSLPASESRALLEAPWFRAATAAASLGEVAVLSTCNRTELYAAVRPRGDAAGAAGSLVSLLARAGGLSEREVSPLVYTHTGPAALRHLCRVAAGLDSMVLGESEVLGQVAAALGDALEASAAGPVLDAAFHSALRAGRRARVETGIGRRPASVASEAVRLLRDRLPALERASVLVLGTGTMGRAVTGILRSAAPRTLRVAGRSAERARAIASDLGVSVVRWEELDAAMHDTDAVVTATAAPHAVITRPMIERARSGRAADRPHVLVDIAVPRDIEPSVATVPNVELFDLGHLQARIQGSLEERRRDVPSVETIVEEEVARFESWHCGEALRPALAALHGRAEEIRRRELERHLRRFGATSPEMREAFDALSRALVMKLLHEPSHRLRAETDAVRSRTYARVVRELFGLAPGDRAHESDGPPA